MGTRTKKAAKPAGRVTATRSKKAQTKKATAKKATTKKATAKKAMTKKATTKKPAAKNTSTKQAGTPKKASKSAVKRTASLGLEVDPDVLELIAAIDEFKVEHGRPFPNWSEVLFVLRRLGYTKP